MSRFDRNTLITIGIAIVGIIVLVLVLVYALDDDNLPSWAKTMFIVIGVVMTGLPLVVLLGYSIWTQGDDQIGLNDQRSLDNLRRMQEEEKKREDEEDEDRLNDPKNIPVLTRR